jgi:hypothetical protein
MICKSCGQAVAEKALICYRCGAATFEAVRQPVRVDSRRRGRAWGAVVVPLAASAAALAASSYGVDLVADPVALGASGLAAAVGAWSWWRR